MPLKNKKLYILSLALLLLLTAAFFISNFIKISRLESQIDKYSDLILEESSETREDVAQINSHLSLIGFDLSKTRASLGLEVNDYFITERTEAQPGKDDADPLLFTGIEALLEAETDLKKSIKIGEFLDTYLLKETIDKNMLVLKKEGNVEFSMFFEDSFAVGISAPDTESIELTSWNGDGITVNTVSNETVHFIEESVEDLINLKNTIKIKTDQLRNISQDPDFIKNISGKFKISFSEDRLLLDNLYNNSDISASVNKKSNNVYFRLSPTGKDYINFDDLKNKLTYLVDNADFRTDDDIKTEEIRQSFQDKIKNEDFLEYLNSNNLFIDYNPRDEIDYFYYDIFRKNDPAEKIGSFAILKKLGEIYLVDTDDVPISSLRTIALKERLRDTSSRLIVPENIPEIEDKFSSADSITFLLVGNHEKNTDTMILVHADKTTNKAFLIGIPRDLYWKGRKINSIYLKYGAEKFKDELSEITGLEISNYIVADMYAFIDMVNILGGIDVTLEEDLIDPTYKIRDNGEWGTLNYPKGTYHLNGVEALRVARSRHGSNDFNRSERQQIIIESLYNKITSLGVKDADRVYAIIDSMFNYVETDFSLIEIIALYQAYKDVNVDGKYVLSFDNILYDTYSNTYMLNEEELDKLDSDFYKGAWILFPRDNDWNNIRWYIREIISGNI